MSDNSILFGLFYSETISRKITDKLSRTLQKYTLSAEKGQSFAELTLKTFEGMRKMKYYSIL